MEPTATIKQAESQMKKAVDHTLQQFTNLHTGKASPSMVDHLSVEIESYGTTNKILEIAAVTTPDARTIRIQPWDKSVLKDIDKAIQKANLGLNPVVMGDSIHVPVPELSGERRKELTKVAHNMAEDGRVGVRAARRDGMDALKKAQKDKEISEDDLKRYEKEVQGLTDKYTKEIEEHLKNKETELTTV
ncbi:MAG: ribosome recycling factor [Opitutales bacterium]